MPNCRSCLCTKLPRGETSTKLSRLCRCAIPRDEISDLPLRPAKCSSSSRCLIPLRLFGSSRALKLDREFCLSTRCIKRKTGSRHELDIRDAMNRGDLNGFDPNVSEELFNALFPAPAAELIKSATALIFIPDDVLSLLPLEVLSPRATKSDFILIDTPTSYFPSAAGLRLTRSVKKPETEWRSSFFGIADPITSQEDARYRAAVDLGTTKAGNTASGLPESGLSGPHHEANRGARLTTRGYYFDRLPETAKEVDNIANLFPNSSTSTTVRTGTEATKIALLQTDLSGYRFIHFATHGFLPVETGESNPLSFFPSTEVIRTK